ncbi:MAG: PDZ domain-containing protein [Acaryochloridaceae cyanobacterium SU_2_1]|nr:PDZ domain-containing protein [Acaryochloridaceae cyanobacterium SU_2_1]
MKIDSSAKRPSSLWSGFLLSLATLSCLQPVLDRPAQAALEDSPKVILDEAWQLVNHWYVDGTFNHRDWQATRQTLLNRNYTSRDQAYTALRQALAELEDPYTRFMAPQEFLALTTQTSGQLSGIGIHMQQSEETKAIVVVKLLPDAPAFKAGLQVGDQILAIDNRQTAMMDIKTASEMIRGESDTAVKLQISRAGQKPFLVTVKRAVIELPTVESSIKQEGSHKIGYIRLQEFSAHASEQMRMAIQRLQGEQVDGFVLDLRGNPGGLLSASIDIAGMWLNNGLIVQTVDRQGHRENIAAHSIALTELPLVVLVDGDSASSSEILTGALQDNQRAKVVGTSTFGKALVQSVHQLSDGSGLAITVSHYYTPKGTDISRKGIQPDIAVGLNPEQLEVLNRDPSLKATASDPQYMRAISTLQQSIGSYQKRNLAPTALPATPKNETAKRS